MTALFSHPYPVVKRGLDVVGAIVLLIGLSPLLGVVAACIWLEDGRPIFFTQDRAGHGGETFRIIKFRSLTQEPDAPARPTAYTTSVGQVLRRWGIDELPQLYNVLRGEMSLVGPRPPLVEDVHKYGREAQVRLQLRPGLTGWAQIHGRNSLTWKERIEFDVWYVRNYSFTVDLKILIWTLPALVQGTGVYGAGNRNPRFTPFEDNA